MKLEEGLKQIQGSIIQRVLGKTGDMEAEHKKQLNILMAMTETELDTNNINSFSSQVKRDIRVVSGCTKDEIESLLETFSQLKAIHSLIKHEKEAGRPLPQNQEELQERLQQSPEALMKEFANAKKRDRRKGVTFEEMNRNPAYFKRK